MSDVIGNVLLSEAYELKHEIIQRTTMSSEKRLQRPVAECAFVDRSPPVITSGEAIH